jgi:phenylacetate-CoA ligase
MTDPDRERKEQAKWRLKPRHAQLSWFDRLLENEFADNRDDTDQNLRRLVHFAAERVPYYKQRFGEFGYTRAGFEGVADLPKLPELNRDDVQDNPDALLASALPAGHKWSAGTRSSATTGHRVRVAQTNISTRHFTLLKQRECRWFRFNPAGSFAAIRQDRNLPRRGGALLPPGETLRLDGWYYLRRFFETGPYYCCNMATALDEQLVWLREIKPDYLMSLSAHLEHLALSCQGDSLGHAPAVEHWSPLPT